MFAGRAGLLCLIASSAFAQSGLTPPAGIRPPYVRAGSAILPGGRAVAPVGYQYFTGPAPVRFSVSPSGNAVACLGSRTLSLFERQKEGWKLTDLPAWQLDAMERAERPPWRSTSSGVAAFGEKAVFTSEGSLGRILLTEWASGRIREIDLNREGFKGSIAGDLAFDAASALLYAADQGNSRIAVVEGRSRQVIASVSVGGIPVSLALGPGGGRLYATVMAPNRNGPVSLVVVDVTDPSTPRVERAIPVGPADASTGAMPAAFVAIAGERVLVSRSDTDSIFVVDPASGRVEKEIELRVPGLEALRGVRPAGMAFHAPSGQLLVAEAGLNAAAVVDVAQGRLLGHVPVGWMPTHVALAGETVFVANTKGMGPGASAPRSARIAEGSVSVFEMPKREELQAYTRYVLEANGLKPGNYPVPGIPASLRRVVLILTRGRSYDEILGDVRAANGPAMGAGELARFGAEGWVSGRGERLSIKRVEVAPNQRALARRGAFSDNFHADPGIGSGEFAFPMALDGSFTSTYVRSGALKRHLEANAITFLHFAAGDANPATSVPDQERASRFIREIEQKYAKGGAELPGLIVVELPNGQGAVARPEDGYPYEESFVADSDVAAGRIVEYLSRTKWWREMAVFIAGEGTEGAEDHIGARRAPLICAGPWCARNHVSHVNTNFPGLVKTILHTLHAPSLDLSDAAAADLSGWFAATPDYSPYQAVAVDKRVFNPPPARGAGSETLPRTP